MSAVTRGVLFVALTSFILVGSYLGIAGSLVAYYFADRFGV